MFNGPQGKRTARNAMKICTIIMFILICESSLAENLIVFATPIKSEFSDYIDPDEKPCPEKSECTKMKRWREYTVNDLNIMSGSYSGETLTFVMSSHTNRFLVKNKRPQRWYVELVNAGLKGPEFRVIDWSLYKMQFMYVNKEQESIAFSAEEGVE